MGRRGVLPTGAAWVGTAAAVALASIEVQHLTVVELCFRLPVAELNQGSRVLWCMQQLWGGGECSLHVQPGLRLGFHEGLRISWDVRVCTSVCFAIWGVAPGILYGLLA